MTEEIKEILNDLKNDNYETEAPTDIEVSNYDLFKVINSVDNDKLLNYITNLQKENTDLKKLCNKYEEEHKTTFETWKKVIARNEKVVELLQLLHYKFDDGDSIHHDIEDIQKELQGGDE